MQKKNERIMKRYYTQRQTPDIKFVKYIQETIKKKTICEKETCIRVCIYIYIRDV